MNSYEIASITIAIVAIVISVASTLYSGYQFHSDIQRDRNKIAIKAVYLFKSNIKNDIDNLNYTIDNHIQNDKKYMKIHGITVNQITPQIRLDYQVKHMSYVTDNIVNIINNIDIWSVYVNYKKMVNRTLVRNEVNQYLVNMKTQGMFVASRMNRIYGIPGYNKIMKRV